MDTNEIIAELIQKLSDNIVDCLDRTNGDNACYIDNTSGETFEEYWSVIIGVCEHKQIDLNAINLQECFAKANSSAEIKHKEQCITKVLEGFIEKFSWTPAGCTKSAKIPYVMNDTKYTQKREEKDNAAKWKKIKEKIKRYEKDFREKQLKPCDFDFQDYNSEVDGSTRYGKGSPEMITYVIDRLVKDKTITNKEGVTQFMKDYAIGIDCSGFVTRAIATVLAALNVEKSIQIETVGASGTYLLTNCTLMASKEFINSGYIETKTFQEKKGKKHFTQNYKITENILSKVRVGDIVCTTNEHYHVRIICKIDRDNKGLPTKIYYVDSSSSENQQGIRCSQKDGILKKYTVVRPYYMDIYYNGEYGTHKSN